MMWSRHSTHCLHETIKKQAFHWKACFFIGSNLDQLVLPGAQSQLFRVLQANLPLGIRVNRVENILVAAVALPVKKDGA